ncbi:MAG: DUF1343 domain-containing protein [Gemmatimonadetes bacterium]|nr:DUF1343 domain-containing protein [Gemmatimonadota bacterium]
MSHRHAVPPPASGPVVRLGVDRVVADPSHLGAPRAVALVTNDAARLGSDPSRPSRVALQAAGVPIARLFGPEHGLGATGADGAPIADGTDPLTGLPVVSLYGERLRPAPAHLAGLDAVVFDVSDVGARFYTYASTLFHVLAACAEAGIALIVLDRPNPLGGVLAEAEGPLLDPALASFVGVDAIPIRHALTLGELARLWHRERWPHATVRVVACDGWTRRMRWPATGLAWVPPSPAMPTFASALAYPGLCLFEGTTLSVARGTEAPFERVGAPWLDADRVVAHVEREPTPGVMLEHDAFVPDAPPHAGERCQGVRVVVRDADALRPVALGLRLLAAVCATHAGKFAWAPYPTAANPTGTGHLDRLVGDARVRAQLEADADRVDAALVRAWTAVPAWSDRVRPVLLYT